jgi:CMP-N,N'-diacetyllegionaminic acid synthase
MGVTVAIIPARGGSKGIPKKNLVDFCGKPLIAWSILQARDSSSVHSVWVSSDSQEIIDTATHYGARPIRRPEDISGDNATSESAWLHALDTIAADGIVVDRVIGMQATSPIRETSDIDAALSQFDGEGLDSLLSCCEVEDFFVWDNGPDGSPTGVNHDYRNRRRRQNLEKRYLENGSFYIFKPEILRQHYNRLGGKIGLFVMEKHKMFQIDNSRDIVLCRAIMQGYGLDK